MRLLNTRTIKLEEFYGPTFPKYAILSHTWGDDEVSFQDISLSRAIKKKGFQKVQRACSLAFRKGFDYVWVDTCCIDKSSSSELSEAINSMFYWYRSSAICFAYLSDLQATKPGSPQLHKCRWFTRGWTLQELIAPRKIEFYDAKWNMIGTKKSLEDRLYRITGISKEVLREGKLMTTVPIAKRMAWASSRETTRIEDTAYSLMGIFNVNIPLLYGERENAFQRLQEEIVRTTHDSTIFAWQSRGYSHKYSGIFAKSPREFVIGGDDMQSSTHLNTDEEEFSITNKGVKMSTSLLYTDEHPGLYILPIGQGRVSWGKDKLTMGIYLAKFGNDSFVRARHKTFHTFEGLKSHKRLDEQVIYILKTMDENTHDSVRRRRCSAIYFDFCSTIGVSKVTPKSLWDSQRKTMLIPTTDMSSAFVCIEVDGEETWPVDRTPFPLASRRHAATVCLLFSFTDNFPVCHCFTFDPKDFDLLDQLDSAVGWDLFIETHDRLFNGDDGTKLDFDRVRLGINEPRVWAIAEGRQLFVNLTEREGDDSPSFRLTVRNAD